MKNQSRKCLVVVLCETREARNTVESLVEKVLKPLSGDLMCFVGDTPNYDDAYTSICKENHVISEPLDWASAFDAARGSKDWRSLLVDEMVGRDLLGGAGMGTRGSGGIIMWFRLELSKYLGKATHLSNYEWICIIRSDYFWEVALPALDSLDRSFVYLLHGEGWGGYSDRFILFNRLEFPEILDLPNPLFEGGGGLKHGLVAYFRRHGFLNPEMYIRAYLDDVVSHAHVKKIPQIGWAQRSSTTSTRWSQGHYSPELETNVKYPNELLGAMITRKIFGRKISSFHGMSYAFRFLTYRAAFWIIASTRLRRHWWNLSGLSSLKNV